MGQPFFSIVIPCLNAAPYLERALRSVVGQAGRDDEVLLVDGGSTDGSAGIARRFADRLTWWCSEPDGGQSAALNKGFARARGRYLLWVNADDLLLPGALRCMRGHLAAQPACRWLTGNLVYIDAQDRLLWCARDAAWRDWLYGHAPVRVYGPTSVFTRELLERVGGFDEKLRYLLDTDLWLRFRAAGARFNKVARYLWAFRVHGGSKTANDLVRKPDPRMEAERQAVYAAHGLVVTREGLWRQRLWRALNGCYARAWIDTRRMRMKTVDRLFANGDRGAG